MKKELIRVLPRNLTEHMSISESSKTLTTAISNQGLSIRDLGVAD